VHHYFTLLHEVVQLKDMQTDYWKPKGFLSPATLFTSEQSLGPDAPALTLLFELDLNVNFNNAENVDIDVYIKLFMAVSNLLHVSDAVYVQQHHSCSNMPHPCNSSSTAYPCNSLQTWSISD